MEMIMEQNSKLRIGNIIFITTVIVTVILWGGTIVSIPQYAAENNLESFSTFGTAVSTIIMMLLHLIGEINGYLCIRYFLKKQGRSGWSIFCGIVLFFSVCSFLMFGALLVRDYF
jgi:hypothetical protein